MFLRRQLSFLGRPVLAGLATLSVLALGAADVSAQEPSDGGAPGIDTETCIGTISASLTASSLPSGSWSAHGDCLTGDSFFEFVEGPILAKAAIADVTYNDGHNGRVAAGVLTLGNGLGLGIVGVEDAATGLIKWSAVLDDFNAEGDSVSVSGDGVAVFPVERATVSARLTGTGTDVKPFLEGYGDPEPIELGGTSADDEPATPASPSDAVKSDGGTVSSDGGTGDGDSMPGASSDAPSADTDGDPVVVEPSDPSVNGIDYGVVETPARNDGS